MIGGRIAALRRGVGWSQAQLAQKLQISPSAVGMYEQGRREPSLEQVVRLAALFGVTTDFLLTGRPASESESQAARQLLQSITELSDGKLQKRKELPFSRQELAVLFAAVLMEP